MNLLSLFSGCGGMDIGFEGDFTCLKKSINCSIHPEWVEEENGVKGIKVFSDQFDVEYFIPEEEYGEEFYVDEDGEVFMKPETVTYFITYQEF